MPVFDQLFPIHFVVDAGLRVCSMGPRVSALMPALCVGARLSDHFELHRPARKLDELDPVALIGSLCRMQAVGKPLSLRVQVVAISAQRFLFACSIHLDRVGDLESVGVDLADFAPHDPTLDFIFLLQAQETALEDARRMARRLADQRLDLRASNRRIAAQYAFSRALADSSQPGQVWSAVASAIGSALTCRAVTVWQCSDKKLDRRMVWDGRSLDEEPASLPLGCGFLGQAALTSEAQWAEAFIAIDGAHDPSRIGTCYAIGVPHDGAVRSLVALHDPRSDHPEDILYLLGDLGVKISQFLEHRAATEKVALQARELEQARDAALESVRAKSNFVATISHEIRTPLNAVIGMTALLLGEDLGRDQREKVQVMRTAGETLLRLVNDVLDFSRAESRRMVLEQATISIDDMLDAIVRQHQAAAQTRGIDLDCLIAPTTPATLTGDPLRLHQILGNLVGNAIKFTDTGSVTIRALPDDDDRIRFEVEDTGVGIAKDDLARLYEPFSQVDSSTTRRYGGTGLGLAICRQLVERMGGELGCDSEPGRGSRFWFVVPMIVQSEQLSASHPADLPHPVPGPSTRPRIEQLARPAIATDESARVLIVEDSPVNQTILQMMLDQLGVAADICDNGADAVVRAASGQYRMVLMDYHMPGMDGLEAARRIRAKMGDRVFIVGCTASTMSGETERCLAAGMDDVVAKPVLPGRLLEVVERYLAVDNQPTAAAEPAPSGPILDPRRLEMLARLGDGSGAIRDRLLNTFLSEAPGRARAVIQAAEDEAAPQLATAAHAFKGMAANLGAVELAALCAEIEAEARQSGVSAQLVARVPEVLRRAVAQLERSTRPAAHHETSVV